MMLEMIASYPPRCFIRLSTPSLPCSMHLELNCTPSTATSDTLY